MAPNSFRLRAFRIFLRCAMLAAVGAGAEAAPPPISSLPFGAKSGPRQATLFTTLSAAQTGVKAFNAYDDPAMWARLYREFSLGAIGTGVAIGDCDGDGRPDIFIVSKTGPNRLFRNLGDFRFEDITERAGVAGPTGAWKQGVAFADVNNDGILDIYVCRFGAPNLLYINQGSGVFREEAAARGLALNDASNMGAFCDYDRDGWLDVYVQTNVLDGERRPNGQRDHLFHNNRDGSFTDVTDAAGISGETQGHSATWWDYDEDGWPDIYIANDFKDPDQLYHNNGNGTFTNVLSWVVPHTPHSSMGADLGDINNDGHLDLLVADMATTTREKDQRGMAKLRAGLTENDQRPEAAPQLMRNALFLNTGTGIALEAGFLSGLDATDWTWSVRLEDLDNDGLLDAHFTNGMVREFHSADLTDRAMTKESFAERIKIMKSSPVLTERHLVFRNRGDLKFEETGAAWGLDQAGVGFGAAFGDLDGDGDLDLVFASFDSEPIVCRNDSNSGNSIIVELRGTASNRFGVGATVHIGTDTGTQMRTLTLARGYLSTSEPAVHFGLGNTTTVRRLSVEWPSGYRQEFSNLAANQRYTVTEANTPAAPAPFQPTPQFTEISESAKLNAVNREALLNELSKQPLAPVRFNRAGPSATLADLDGDGEDDLVLGGVTGEAGQLFSNLGGAQFMAYGGNLFSDAAATADGPILAVDANGDGALDLLVTKAGVAAPVDAAAYQPRLLLNGGDGRFKPAPAGLLPALPISVGAAVAADFERSGRLGVFLGARMVPGKFPQAPRSALLAWRNDRYVDVISELAPDLATRGMVTAALWSDVDSDGWPDLLVAFDWGNIACYRNVGGKRFEDVSEKLGFSSAGTGWWHSLVAADFNGDGRLDYAVGNTGLNTPYRASADEPALLYAGVSVNGGPPQLVEAQMDHGRIYPRRSRDVMIKYFPSIAAKYRTTDDYAKASLDDLFPAAALASATKLAATELRSGVFLSQPGGTFRFTPLPRLAQIAPIFGMAAGDFDGDGRSDLVVVGNSFAPISEVGRFDGGAGWILRGDGRGQFTPIEPAASGFIVRRDAKALAVADLNRDGWPDLFVTRNNDRALAFVNRALPGRHSFGVALRGAAGNPAAIGAQVTLTLADGSTQTAEISAGAGYFSQSSATTFFGYPDSAPPKHLSIRWPDGRVSEQSFTTPPSRISRLPAP